MFENEEHLSSTPQCVFDNACWRHCWQTNRSNKFQTNMKLTIKIKISRCNSLIVRSFILPDGRKKKEKVVVGVESSSHKDDSGVVPDVGVSLTNKFPLVSLLYIRLLVMRRRRDWWKTRVRRPMMSWRSFLLVGQLQMWSHVSQSASFSKKRLGELVSFRRQTLLRRRLEYRYVSFQTSI